MSWLLNQAESLLNNLDQSAASALHHDDSTSSGSTLPTTSHSPYFGESTDSSAPPARPASTGMGGWTDMSSSLSVSASVPSNMNRLSDSPSYLSQMSRSTYNPSSGSSHPPSTASSATSSAQPKSSPSRHRKDKDAELFEFLNSSENIEPKTKKHSRHSSVSSTSSRKSSNVVPDPNVILDRGSPETPGNGSDGRSSTPGTQTTESFDGMVMVDHADTLSSRNSDENNGTPGNEKQISSIELENQLLKNEVASLNQEMSSILTRAKNSQDEMMRIQRQIDSSGEQLRRSEQLVRELQARENDLLETLGAKDAQIGVLRVRYEEADKQLETQKRRLVDLETDRTRILDDHTSVSGAQSQALDAVQAKLHEAERALQREQEAFQTSNQETMSKQMKLESEKQKLAESLTSVEKKLTSEKGRSTDLASQVKAIKTQLESSRQELQEYKEKATRILQSKDKLISSMRDGGVSSEETVSTVELEEANHEKDLLRTELQQSRANVESLRTELQDLEMHMQTELEGLQDECRELQESLTAEVTRRDDAEQEVARQKQELRYAHEELLRQKTQMKQRIQDRETEIERLRNQLTAKSMSTSSQTELENRLHALTESLIQKQTMLEALSTEKNSLCLQLERMEAMYREAESSAVKASVTTVAINDEEELRQRVPAFMRESPLDGDVTRKVKRAANTIDKFSVRLGVFLRRYPIARLFIIAYMVMLHLWVMVVLLTYQPEVHTADFQPLPPGQH